MNAACATWRRRCARWCAAGCYRAGANPAETEDVVQDILIAVHLKRHTWDETPPDRPVDRRHRALQDDRCRAQARPPRRSADRGFRRHLAGRRRRAETAERARCDPLARQHCRSASASGERDRDRGRLDCGRRPQKLEYQRGRGAGRAASRAGRARQNAIRTANNEDRRSHPRARRRPAPRRTGSGSSSSPLRRPVSLFRLRLSPIGSAFARISRRR